MSALRLIGLRIESNYKITQNNLQSPYKTDKQYNYSHKAT